MTTYYIAMASTKFLLEQEPIEEMLRERKRYYKENNLPIDFWLIRDFSSINEPELKKLETYLMKPMSMIISSNKRFIDWIKLRVNYVLVDSFESDRLHFDINL